jgi:hypothetical protein
MHLWTHLLQYVDDPLFCGPLEDTAFQATKPLLNFLADWGHKVSMEKAQFCQIQVTYLGFVLTKGTRALGNDRIQPILAFPPPRTLKQLRAFLGVTDYCRIWISGYADLA